MEMDKEKLRRLFPHIADEIARGDSLSIGSTEDDTPDPVKHGELYRGYMPTAVDYIRRCKDADQAEQTIDYLERAGEVTKEYAEALRKQLQEKGLESFGPTKEDDYYLKKGGY